MQSVQKVNKIRQQAAQRNALVEAKKLESRRLLVEAKKTKEASVEAKLAKISNL